MKQYVTLEEYRSLGGAIPDTVSDAILDRWLQYATAKVDQMTFNRIHSHDTLMSFQRELVQRATVVQADYLYGLDSTVGLDFNASSWSITDVSMSLGGTNESPSAVWNREQHLSPVALDYLNQSGLTWRGI